MEYYFNYMPSIICRVKIAVGTHLKSRNYNSAWFQNVRHGHLSAVLITFLSVRLKSLKSKLDVWESERNFILERKIERLESD